MKQIVFKDVSGNGAAYRYLAQDSLNTWNHESVLDFLRCGTEEMETSGYLVRPADPIRHVTLRELVHFPEQTLNHPVLLFQEDRLVDPSTPIQLTGDYTIIELRRDETDPFRISEVFDLGARNRRCYAGCRREMVKLLDHLLDLNPRPVRQRDGQFLHSFGGLPDRFRNNMDEDEQIRFLFRVAEKLHQAPFENVSKIDYALPFRTGHEVWANLGRGYGGVCAEKTSALKFVCDVLELDSSPVVGSQENIPDELERLYRGYVETEGEKTPPVWIQHHLLEISVGERKILIDATNGNIPFLFKEGLDVESMINRKYRARMVYNVERLRMKRTTSFVGDLLLTLSEFHVPDLYFQYIFQQGLGLHISADLFIGVFFDWGGERSLDMEQYYSSNARKLRLPYPRFMHAANLEGVPEPATRELLGRTLECLRDQYADPNYTGDFTFVIQPLTGNFWKAPRISRSMREILA